MPTEQLHLASVIFLAVLQGVTELFPVSSLGHSIVYPALFHLSIDITAQNFLPLLTALHLGTALALLLYFRKDWIALVTSLFQKSPEAKPQQHLFWSLVIGTIPAGIVGLLFEKKLKMFFGSVQFVAAFLILNGAILILGEKLRKREGGKNLEHMTFVKAFWIGVSQIGALFPGISRSGISLVSGILSGFTLEAAARFSFLLATPIILAASLLEIPKLFTTALRPALSGAVIGGVIAGVVAFITTSFLMRYFKRHDFNALLPFGVYCLVLGLISLLGFHF